MDAVYQLNGRRLLGGVVVSCLFSLEFMAAGLVNNAAAAVEYDNPTTKTQVTLNPGGAAVTLKNVADGAVNATSTDAVNGRQLSDVHEGVVFAMETLRDAVVDVAKGAATLGEAHDMDVRYTVQALGGGAQADPVSGTLIAPAYRTTAIDASGGAGSEPVISNTVGDAISTLNSSVSNTAAAGVKYDDPAAKTQVTLNRGGTAVALANVAEGAVSADSREAVNGSQLFSSEQQAVNAIAETKRQADQRIDTLDVRVDEVKSATADLGKGFNKVSEAVGGLQQGTAGAFRMNSDQKTPRPEATGVDAVAGGGGAQAKGERSVALGAAARSSAKNAVALGSKATATADNSVALGANTVAERADTVSVGRSGGERQITHVASGSRATDAVNVSQLDRRVAGATQDAHAYTDQRHEQLRRDLKHQDNTLSAGIAGAMAMASLPRSSVAGGSMTSMAMGSYRGESAVALGVSYVSPSGRWASNLMGTTNTRNDTGVAVGMGYQW